MEKKRAISGGYRAPAVERAFQLLESVAAAAEEPRLSDLSRALGFSKSTTHGLVRALVAAGALVQDPESLRLSLGPVIVSLASEDRHFRDLGERVQPLLDRLRDEIDETVFFGMMSVGKTRIIAASEAQKSMKISGRPGTAIPLLAGAVGKVFLAQMDAEAAQKAIRRLTLTKFTDASIVDRKRFLAEVEKARKEGVAMDRGEYLSGVNAVAAGLGKRGWAPLALWAVGFAESMGPDRMGHITGAVRSAAALLEEQIGSVPAGAGR